MAIHTDWRFVAEVIAMQPFVHAKNGVTDPPPLISQCNNSVRGRENVIRQMSDKFCYFRFTEMTGKDATFGFEFFIIEPIMQMTANHSFINKLRLGDQGSRPAFSRR